MTSSIKDPTVTDALAKFDAVKTQCPFDKVRSPPSWKPCPKCRATNLEPCRKQVVAAFDFVSDIRSMEAKPDPEGLREALELALGDLKYLAAKYGQHEFVAPTICKIVAALSAKPSLEPDFERECFELAAEKIRLSRKQSGGGSK